MLNGSDRRRGRHAVLAVATLLALAPALGACTNTIEGAEKDSRRIFGTAGGSPTSDKNPTSSNAKGGWTNPQ